MGSSPLYRDPRFSATSDPPSHKLPEPSYFPSEQQSTPSLTIKNTAAASTSSIYQTLTRHSDEMPTTISFTSTIQTKPSARSIYHKKMSVTQTYMIAHQARGKLAKEANCPDHNLHRLVCHANMLDTLIFNLAHAEEEQERYLNKLTASAKKPAKKSKPEKWARVVMEKLQEETEREDSQELSSDDDSSDDEYEHWENRVSEKTNSVVIITSEEPEAANQLQEEYARLSLERTKSRHHASHHSPSSKHTKTASKSR